MPRTKTATSLEEVVQQGVAKLQHDVNAAVYGLMFNAFKESLNGSTKTRRRRRSKRTAK